MRHWNNTNNSEYKTQAILTMLGVEDSGSGGGRGSSSFVNTESLYRCGECRLTTNWMETAGQARESASQHSAGQARESASQHSAHSSSCVPHSNPGLGSLLPLILQLEKLDAN